MVGAGGWGKNHLRVLSEQGCLAAICDVNEERLSLYREKYKVAGYASVDQMLVQERLDGITICAPTSTHQLLAKKSLERKLPTFVEKPLAATSSEAEELVSLAKQHKIPLAVGFIERFNPAVAALKEMISRRSLGESLLLEFHRENRWAGNVTDVGIVKDTSVHDIDTARWLMGGEPFLVFARTGRALSQHEDFAAIILGFQKDRTAFIASNWVTPKRVRQLSAVFTHGVANLDFISQELRIEDSEGIRIPRIEKQEPLLLELRNFLECIEGKGEPLVSGADALKTTKVAEAALVSSETGAPIYLDL